MRKGQTEQKHDSMDMMVSQCLEVKLPTIWTDGGESSQRKERVRREEVRKERVRRQKIKVREKVQKSRSTVCVSQCFVAVRGDETGKIARRCAAKHIWKSKSTKHLSVGALLEVAIL